jgi:hypothetical protein
MRGGNGEINTGGKGGNPKTVTMQEEGKMPEGKASPEDVEEPLTYTDKVTGEELSSKLAGEASYGRNGHYVYISEYSKIKDVSMQHDFPEQSEYHVAMLNKELEDSGLEGIDYVDYGMSEGARGRFGRDSETGALYMGFGQVDTIDDESCDRSKKTNDENKKKDDPDFLETYGISTKGMDFSVSVSGKDAQESRLFTIYHEVGHLEHYLYMKSVTGKEDFKETIDADTELKDIIATAKVSPPTKYSFTSDAEYYAECRALYRAGKDKLLDPKMVKYLKKVSSTLNKKKV